mmetsp:Transcript_26953/g.81603  ORF Transcript_26953/g.81603 Transcript_26953/m.81603 type:complete len:90 (-) Transcript_26953:173-442(-)
MASIFTKETATRTRRFVIHRHSSDEMALLSGSEIDGPRKLSIHGSSLSPAFNAQETKNDEISWSLASIPLARAPRGRRHSQGSADDYWC